MSMPRNDVERWAGAAPNHHPAVMDTHPATVAATRLQGFLEREPVVWLSTVRPDGAPHLVPIWFWWDGEALLVFSKPEAQKVRNLRAHPTVMLALGDAEDDFDVGLARGRAELLDQPTAEVMPAAHLAKYAGKMASIGVSAEEYAATYSQVIRIVPDAFLPWHGRTSPRSVRLAGAPAFSIDEPRRPADAIGPDGEPVARRSRPSTRPIVEPARPGSSLRDWLGEPLARGLRGLTGGLRPAPAGLV
jgi:PPOX class probable F420-dependent enzyme